MELFIHLIGVFCDAVEYFIHTLFVSIMVAGNWAVSEVTDDHLQFDGISTHILPERKPAGETEMKYSQLKKQPYP